MKLLILLIFVLNAKSWPFVWHGKSLPLLLSSFSIPTLFRARADIFSCSSFLDPPILFHTLKPQHLKTSISNPETSKPPYPAKNTHIPHIIYHISGNHALRPTVKVWYPAILAHYKARRYGLKDYYRRLQIGLPGALSRSTSTDEDNNRTGSLQLQLPDKVQRALDLGRKHKFEHPLGVKSTRRYSAGFDDCEYLLLRFSV